MFDTPTSTDQVLAAARKGLKDQLEVIHSQIARLEAEERAVTDALLTLERGGASTAAVNGKRHSSSRGAATRSTSTSTRKPSSRGRPRGTIGKSTAERLAELSELLTDGPKSRKDLAAALRVSPARVQQLLNELGRSVSSQPDPNQRRAKLWSLSGAENGASAEARRRRPAQTGATRPASAAAAEIAAGSS